MQAVGFAATTALVNGLRSAKQAESYLHCFCCVEKHQKVLTYCK
jgi:hypothetical protein